MSPDQFRYTTRFVAKGHVVQKTDALVNEVVASASLNGLKGLLPSNIDPADCPDLLFVAANLAVGGVANANDDSLSLEDTLAVYKRFEMKLCDVEHERQTIVGFILKAGLSELGTNRLITEEEARAANRPCNIATITVLWKVANRDLCNFIQAAGIPGSPENGSLSLSFEVGFNDYDIVVLPKGTTELVQASRIISPDDSDFDKYDKLLRINKGKGVVKDTGERVARILAGKIVPLGEGIVTVPAAAVKGLLPLLGNDDAQDDETEATDGPHTYSSTHVLIPKEYADAMLVFAASIPDNEIYAEPGYGRETESHITTLYGIKTSDATSIAPVVKDFGEVTAYLGAISSFENGDKPYDVLKVDVHSTDLCNLHNKIKGSTDCHISWPIYSPHLTLAYMKKGMAKKYIGDKRFGGINMTFDSLVFSPNQGDKVNLPLTSKADDSVYSSMMNRIKLSQGWKERFASFKSKDSLVNAVTVTLSDGRVLKNVHVFNGEELELDKSLSMEGVIITDMTPGVPPQVDDSKVIHPHVGDVYPTVRPEKQVENAKRTAEIHEAQKAAYTDASTKMFESLKKISDVITSQSRVSTITSESHNMNLDKLNQVKASLEKGETKEAVASITVLAEEIARASEQWDKSLKQEQDRFAKAEKAREEAVAASQALEKQVGELKASLTEMKNAQAAAQAEAQFQARMASLEEVFDLDDEIRAMLMEEVKACDTDESFAKFMDKSKKLMKEKTKEFKKKKEAKANEDAEAKKKDMKKVDKDDDQDDDDDDTSASEAIASAKENRVDVDIHNNIDVNPNETTLERMQRVFAQNTEIGGVSVKKRIKKNDQE